jgi:hypothetical protein
MLTSKGFKEYLKKKLYLKNRDSISSDDAILWTLGNKKIIEEAQKRRVHPVAVIQLALVEFGIVNLSNNMEVPSLNQKELDKKQVLGR